MGALRQLADDGLVQMVGVSNADVAQIDVARSIVGDAFVSVQNQFSPGWRFSADELAHCAAHGLAFLPWSPLGGLGEAKQLAEQHPAFAEVADSRGVSPQQVALAWELAQSEVVIPIPGAKRAQSIRDSAAAADLDLTPEELARLDQS
jgi:aryl-alcohol dehydrogenase-like predicted oxidoreductase